MDINIEMMELKAGLARIEGLLNAAAASEKNRNTIYDNSDVMKMLHVSRRTLSTWREKGIIGYTQYSGKIYYAQSDLDEFMGRFHIKAFAYKMKRV